MCHMIVGQLGFMSGDTGPVFPINIIIYQCYVFYIYLLTRDIHAIGRHICEFLYVILGLKSSLSKFLRTRQIELDETDQMEDF